MKTLRGRMFALVAATILLALALGLTFVTDVLQDRLFLVGKGDTLDMDARGNLRQRVGARPVLNLRFVVDDLENPLRPGYALLDGVIHVGQAFDRFIEHDQGREKGKKGPRRGYPLNDLIPAIQNDGGDTDPPQELHERARSGIDGDGLDVESEKALVLLGKAAILIGLHTEGLDDPGSRDGFVQEGVETSHGYL
jgi:hypothetical protein